ncbi:MAG TPA: hypothetical protein VFY36_01135 [Solirubrobacteraceae bacterium]|nr:hypothetical protein [Solirubrobacteraceae bacterium]
MTFEGDDLQVVEITNRRPLTEEIGHVAQQLADARKAMSTPSPGAPAAEADALRQLEAELPVLAGATQALREAVTATKRPSAPSTAAWRKPAR